MIELTEQLQQVEKECRADISLSGWLEAIVDHYYVDSECGWIEEFYWLYIYYNEETDTTYECVEQVPENLVAYVSADYRWCFVLNKHLEKFKRDTAGYGLHYIPVSDFGEEMFQCSNIDMLPKEFSNIVWIDDDFMYDESIPFDYDSFSLIDDKIPYLNPKHFSVGQLVMVMESNNQ